MLAQKISLFLWNEPVPTPDLAAEARKVETVNQLRELVAQVLRDERADAGIRAFIRSYLKLDNLSSQPKQDPSFTDELRRRMVEEAPDVAVEAIRRGNGTFESLFLADFTIGDDILAAHYGIAAPGTGKRRLPFNPAERLGILGGAGALTRYSGDGPTTWPPRRYWMLTDTLLCETEWSITPPPGIDVAMAINPAVGLRKQTIDLTHRDTCLFCHPVVNSFGFAFMGFDSLGRYRDTDADGPIDTNGDAPATSLGPGIQFSNQPELMRRLVGRSSTRRCFSRRWLAYALRLQKGSTVLEDRRFLQTLDHVHEAFESSGLKIAGLLSAIVESEHFLRGPD